MKNYGVLGLIAGLIAGSIVTVVVTRIMTTDQGGSTEVATTGPSGGMTMTAMTASLQNKTGAAYDQAFIEAMTEHHQGAIDIAKLSADRAQHAEVKDLSQTIIAAQEQEIADMSRWLEEWGLAPSAPSGGMNSMSGMSH